MPDIIQLLPDSIANQIAAGEVVQRPASVVKELMENAVDAGANQIRLVLREAGKSFIQVIDNGSGMSDTDARLSLERHATSKIRKAEDLFTIRTMGFRGEALASIAAVSQLEICTRQEHRELGTVITVEASDVKRQEPAACEKGTRITVRNLFYNIPARRNFLKSNAVEMLHVQNEFFRLALAHADKSFQLIHHDELLFDLQPGKLSQRIVALFGKSYQQQLAPCEEETSLVKITGYLGRPEAARKKKDEQFLFVNNRFIRSNYLSYAVRDAFAGLIAPDTHPFFVLFLEIDPKHLDVNVHPTKTEIKFDDERAVYAVVSAAARQALGTRNLAPSIDFAADVNLVAKIQNTTITKEQYMNEQFGSLAQNNLRNWEKIFETERPVFGTDFTDQSETTLSYTEAEVQSNFSLPEQFPVFQFRNRYVFFPLTNGVRVVDQQAAHERVLFEKFVRHLRSKHVHAQQLMFPVTVTLNPADFALVWELELELRALGFQLEPFGKETVLITAVPAEISGQESRVLEELLEQFKAHQQQLNLPLNEKLAAALAKRSSLATGKTLSIEEMRMLIQQLFACKQPAYTPDGNPTFFQLETSNIERYFTR
jgi:DNA mismatch repair protein MutL